MAHARIIRRLCARVRLARVAIILHITVAIVSLRDACASGPWFEAAPPTLPFYIDRLPAKSLEDIFKETGVTGANGFPLDYHQELFDLAKAVREKPVAQLIAKVDEWLDTARHDSQANPGLFNLLHDLRDALATPNATPDELANYIVWRCNNVTWFGFMWNQGNARPRTRYFEEEPNLPEGAAQEIEEKLANASPALKPQWMYLRGALGFKAGEDTESQKWFERVLADFPQHPRAEAALFMDARCQLSRSRTYSTENADKVAAAANRPHARELFEQYQSKYPKGQFAADAIGWIGAIRYDEQNYIGALPFYIQQTELTDHPEVLSSALGMCEKILAHIAAQPEETALKEVAARPRLAMGLMYFIVNTTEADDFDGKYDDAEVVRKWRRKILPQLGAAVASSEKLYRNPEWQPRYLAILAEGAVAAGKMDDALRLTSDAKLLEQSDDLAFARAIALNAAHRSTEAISAFEFFLKRFGRSKLAKGAQLRYALALQDAHRAGDAVLQLQRLESPPEKKAEEEVVIDKPLPEDRSDAEPEQVRQFVDTLLNFAPLSELAVPLSKQRLPQEQSSLLTAVLAQRYLARENFAEAKKYIAPAEWSVAAESVERATDEFSHAPKARQAELCALIGDMWQKNRGKLLKQPLESVSHCSSIFNDQAQLADSYRVQNARALGLDVDEELARRDELGHAQAWWLRAAETAPHDTAAAKWLWKALAAIPEIARTSDFAEATARKTDVTKRSRELYERLRHDFPDSIEARRLAAYWSFPPEEKEESESDAEGGFVQDDVLSRWGDDDAYRNGYPYSDYGAFRADSSASPYYDKSERSWDSIIPEIRSLDANARDHGLSDVRATVDQLLTQGRAAYRSNDEAIYLNFLEDMSLFLHEPVVNDRMAQTYIGLRLGWLKFAYSGMGEDFRETKTEPDNIRVAEKEWHDEVDLARKDKNLKPIADYLDFLDIAFVAHKRVFRPADDFDKDGEPFTYSSRDYPQLEKLSRAFLARYPKSRKREAAAFLLAKAVSAQSRPYLVAYGINRNGSTVGNWMDSVDVQMRAFQYERFDAKRVLAPIAAYEREFPKGRYAADIANLRGAWAWRSHNWAEALDETVGQLADGAHVDLQPEAELRLASIFADLANPDFRADLISALHNRLTAVRHLREFLARANLSRSHPLRYLGDFLGDQLGFKPEYGKELID